MAMSRAERWALAPVALLLLDTEARVLDANDEFLRTIEVPDVEAVAGRRLADLLTVGGRIFWETHVGPRLHIEGRVDEVAVELRTPRGREPVLLTAIEREARGERLIEVAMLGARERSRFEHELVEARRAAEEAERRVRLLHGVAADLASVAGLDGVAWVLLRAAVTMLGAGDAALWTAQERGPLRRWGGAVGVLAPTIDELTEATVRDDGTVVVPLRTAGALLGVLALEPRRAAGSDPVDLGTAAAAGQLAALALSRARVHEQSVSVASELQGAMLSDGIVTDPQVEVSACYRPGVHDLQVGGDWYDTFRVAPDVVALSVGDVVGRGLKAATSMGQLRTAVRAASDTGLPPEEVVERVDRFVDRTGTGFMASLVYGELDLRAGVLRYTCAGHLPPLLVRAGGSAAYLWEARSTPLGVRGTTPRVAKAVRLAPGDLLLLFTDGVVERRDRPLALALDELADVVTRALDVGLRDDRLLEAVVSRAPEDDDACLLAVRWLGPATDGRAPVPDAPAAASADEERAG
ncbi:PP2C family protein-serine/threonine phosphatase [Cellulosimicrobium funkei]|uniref:PP2C family protein-serine/threonine phosphatase n=1 Tax=Cellulosimicrobium funkei TaxID=264251 RepID=UPI003757CFD9